MIKKVMFFWSKLTTSFWFVPVLIIFSSIFLALFFLKLDSLLTFPQEGLGRYLFIKSPESARSVLSTISSAMIGVAGTVFSITLVALTLASSQFGSRLIKNFMYIRLNQVVLGTYIATYAYCLLILNTVESYDKNDFVPSLSILIAITVTIVNIILLIVFIHNIAISMQAESVVSDISNSIEDNIKKLYPNLKSDNKEEEIEWDIIHEKKKHSKHKEITAIKNGYIQYVNVDKLLEISTTNSLLIEVCFRTGDYVIKDTNLCKIYFTEELSEEVIDEIESQFIIGNARTPQQDMEFSLHQMVEIACRALSPGINDPYTAITCIDNLSASIANLSRVKLPNRYRTCKKNELRVIVNVFDFEGLVNSAFNQIRIYAKGNTAVIIRLMNSLVSLYNYTDDENYKKVIRKHGEMILNIGKSSIEEEYDLNHLFLRSKELFISE